MLKKFCAIAATLLFCASANAARFIEVKFQNLGARFDVVFDTQDASDPSSPWSLATLDYGQTYAELDSNGFMYYSDVPSGFLYNVAELNLSGVDFSAPSFNIILHNVGDWSATYIYSLAREDFVGQISGGVGRVQVIGTDDILTPGIGYFGNLSSPPALPDPSTWLLMVVGIGMVGSSMRSRRRAAINLY